MLTSGGATATGAGAGLPLPMLVGGLCGTAGLSRGGRKGLPRGGGIGVLVREPAGLLPLEVLMVISDRSNTDCKHK